MKMVPNIIYQENLEDITYTELKSYMFNSKKQQEIKKEEETMAFFAHKFLSFNLNNYSFLESLIKNSSNSIVSIYENCRKFAKKHDIVSKISEHLEY